MSRLLSSPGTARCSSQHGEIRQLGAHQCCKPLPRLFPAFPSFPASWKAEEERVALTHAGPGRAEPIADSSGSGGKDFPTA